jgi:hypothetical protein
VGGGYRWGICVGPVVRMADTEMNNQNELYRTSRVQQVEHAVERKAL